MSNIVTTAILWTVVVITAIFFIQFIHKRLRIRRMVNKLPGPKSHPILGISYDFIGIPREDLFNVVQEMLSSYVDQGIFRVWAGPVPFVFLVNPQYIEPLASSAVQLDKSYVYSFTHSWLGRGLLTSTGEKWRSRRKLLTHAFHFSILEEFLPVFNEQSMILVDKLDSEHSCDNLFHLIALCSLDIICGTAMGCNISAQLDEDSEYVTAVFEATKAIFYRARSPWYYPNFIYDISNPGRKHKHNVNVLKSFTRKIIKERREEQQKIRECKQQLEENNGRRRRLAFLDILLQYGEGKLSDDDIQEEVDTFMFEGHDTTASAIYWVLFFLGLNLPIQKKVQEELDEIFGDSDRHVSTDDLPKMKYLDLVCKESLRLIPSIPIIARRLKEDLNLGDYVIPTGVDCCIAPMMTHTREYLYPNPGKFDPDRFLPENCKERHPYAYIPFSAGKRNCIGQKFAKMEEKVVLSNILRKFEVITEPLPENAVPVIPEIINRPSDKIKMTVKRRQL